MKQEDYQEFMKFFSALSEVVPNPPSREGIYLYWEILSRENLTLNEIKNRAMLAVKEKGFFPLLSEFFDKTDPKKEAILNYELLRKLVERYYYPDFSECSCSIIETKLREIGRTDLIPSFYRWGAEIIENPSYARKNFIETYIAKKDMEKKLEAPKEPKKIDINDLKTLGDGNENS